MGHPSKCCANSVPNSSKPGKTAQNLDTIRKLAVLSMPLNGLKVHSGLLLRRSEFYCTSGVNRSALMREWCRLWRLTHLDLAYEAGSRHGSQKLLVAVHKSPQPGDLELLLPPRCRKRIQVLRNTVASAQYYQVKIKQRSMRAKDENPRF